MASHNGTARTDKKGSDVVLDIFRDVSSQEVPGVSLQRSTVWTNEELLKVPGDI